MRRRWRQLWSRAFGAKNSGCCDGTTRIAGFESGWHSSTPTTRRPGRPLGTTTCSPRPTRGCRPDSTAPVVARTSSRWRRAMCSPACSTGARGENSIGSRRPTGRFPRSRIPIDYSSEDGPVLAVRLQELFGLHRVAGGARRSGAADPPPPVARPPTRPDDPGSRVVLGGGIFRGPSGVARPLSEASLARGSAYGDPDQPGETALLTVDHTVGATRRSHPCSIRLRAGPRRCRPRPTTATGP